MFFDAVILFERSLTWATALADKGMRVATYDILPPLIAPPPGVYPVQADFRAAPAARIILAFPPCTHLSAVGATHWLAKAAAGKTLDALAVLAQAAERVYSAKHGLIENPTGLARRLLGPPSTIVHPAYYALTPHELKSKRTCLWLHNWPQPMCRYTDPTRQLFMSWAASHCQITRSQSWPGMAAAYSEVLHES